MTFTLLCRPEQFQDRAIGTGGVVVGGAESRLQPAQSDHLSDSESDSDLFVNTNRQAVGTQVDDSYSSDSN